MKRYQPATGSRRIVKRFLLLPKKLESYYHSERYVTRWLEFVEIDQFCFHSRRGWENTHWHDI